MTVTGTRVTAVTDIDDIDVTRAEETAAAGARMLPRAGILPIPFREAEEMLRP